MKNLLAGVAIASMLASTAYAGGMAEPMMEPEVVVEESTGSSGGFVVPLILLAVIVAVASSSSSSDTADVGSCLIACD